MRGFISGFVVSMIVSVCTAQSLEVIATGLEKPCDIAFDPTTPGRWFVVEQTGAVRVVTEDEGTRRKPLITVEDRASGRADFTGPDSNWERGLLGIALEPGYGESGRVYLYYTDGDGDVVLSRFTVDDPAGEPTVTWSSEERLLEIDEPYGNHNGGCIRFGPDGMLYVGPGDGGSANDPQGNGQKLNTLLGKLLRIDVMGEPDDGLAYAVPGDNPFVGDDGARDEIFAYGLRNPWRFEFDSAGRLWIADVGQNRFEEVHVVPVGADGGLTGGLNFGWNVLEGAGEFRRRNRRVADPRRQSAEEQIEQGFEPVVFEYKHHPIASITGGYFYEGSELGWLRNRYICADFTSGRTWTFKAKPAGDGRVKADDIVEITPLVRRAWGSRPQGAISSFGLDGSGEVLVVLDHSKGRVLRFGE